MKQRQRNQSDGHDFQSEMFESSQTQSTGDEVLLLFPPSLPFYFYLNGTREDYILLMMSRGGDDDYRKCKHRWQIPTIWYLTILEPRGDMNINY